MQKVLPIPSEQWNAILSLCVARILSLDPSVSCYWYRRHGTLWRQWWIWPSSLSPLLWNLRTVRGSVTVKIFISWFWSFNKLLLCCFHPHFLSTTNQRMLNNQASVDATVLPKRQLQHSFDCSFFTEIFNLRITLHYFLSVNVFYIRSYTHNYFFPCGTFTYCILSTYIIC